jgi:hypothetical protein
MDLQEIKLETGDCISFTQDKNHVAGSIKSSEILDQLSDY